MKTVGIGIVIWKTVAVGTRFFRIYETNKIKYSENNYKLIENDNFYIFLKMGMVGNDIIK